MDSVSSANGVGACLRQSDESYFSLFDEPRHGADCFFYRRLRIDAMLVIEIDNIHIQAAQRAFAGRADVLRSAANSANRRITWIPCDAELGCEYDVVAPAANSAADQHFILKRPVHVG